MWAWLLPMGLLGGAHTYLCHHVLGWCSLGLSTGGLVLVAWAHRVYPHGLRLPVSASLMTMAAIAWRLLRFQGGKQKARWLAGLNQSGGTNPPITDNGDYIVSYKKSQIYPTLGSGSGTSAYDTARSDRSWMRHSDRSHACARSSLS